MSGQLTLRHRLPAAARRLSVCFATSRQLCLRMLFWRLALPVLKYIVPMRTLARLMWAAPRRSGEDRDRRVQEVIEVWRTGGRLLVSRNCLERSLLLYRLLSREGARPSLVFGVDRRDGSIAGHAWVELHDEVVHESSAAYDRVAIFGANGQLAEIRS